MLLKLRRILSVSNTEFLLQTYVFYELQATKWNTRVKPSNRHIQSTCQQTLRRFPEALLCSRRRKLLSAVWDAGDALTEIHATLNSLIDKALSRSNRRRGRSGCSNPLNASNLSRINQILNIFAFYISVLQPMGNRCCRIDRTTV